MQFDMHSRPTPSRTIRPRTADGARLGRASAREEELRRDELTGHLDIRAWHSDHGEAIIDLKTGASKWVPLFCRSAATYILTFRCMTDGDMCHRKIGRTWGGVLACAASGHISKDVKGTLELRQGGSDCIVRWCGNQCLTV